MKKHLTFALATFLLAAALSVGTLFTANAAIRDDAIADSIIDASGIQNDRDWDIPQKDVYKLNLQDAVIRFKDVVWGAGWVHPYDTVDFTKGDAVFEFDVFNPSGCNIRPVLGEQLTSCYKTIWFSDTLANFAGSADLKGVISLYKDYECTQAWDREIEDSGANHHTAFNALYIRPTDKGKHIKFVYKPDGTFGCEVSFITENGTREEHEKIYIKDAFKNLDTSVKYHIGLNSYGNLLIDNIKATNKDEVVFETDCEGEDWYNSDGVPKAGLCLVMGGGVSVYKESAIVIDNPENSDRITSWEPIKIDDNVEKALELSGKIKVENLGKKFGFAFGLETQDAAITENSYVYIYNKEVESATVTFIASNGTGEEVSLEQNLAAAEGYTDFSIVGMKNGNMTVKVGDKTAEFTGMKIAGHVAIVTDGEGEAKVSLDGETSLHGYAYRASESSDPVMNNFNTGYINPRNWITTPSFAVNFEDSEKAEGLIAEDGVMFFKGTSTGAWFGTSKSYSDFVMEFDYISVATDNRPALKSTWEHGYSNLHVIVGGRTGSGWTDGIHIALDEKQDLVQLHNMKMREEVPEKYPKGDGSYVFKASADADKKTAVKIISANNKIIVYVQDITTEEFNKDSYIKMGEFDVADAYGMVSFSGDDCAYFKIDNVRIVPVDDPNPDVIEQKIAAFEDKQPIPDEVRPYELDVPEPTLSGNVVSWKAVDRATGYKVTVNGVVSELITETSYTIPETAAGEYKITVKAIGNGETILDSEASETITYVIKAADGDNSGGDASGGTDGKKGCGCKNASVTLGGIGAFGLVLLAAGLIAKKRRV